MTLFDVSLLSIFVRPSAPVTLALVWLDSVRHPMLATGAVQLRDAQKVVAVHTDPDDVVAPQTYRSRCFLTEQIAVVQEPLWSALNMFPYEEPDSGTSRDAQLWLREGDVIGRAHWKTLASLCYYEKGVSLHLIARPHGVTTLSCGETMIKSFHAFFLFAVGLGLLGNPGVTNQGDSSASRL